MIYMQMLVNPIDNGCNMYHFYRQEGRKNKCVKPSELPPEAKTEFNARRCNQTIKLKLVREN